jgi:hypothetical protein
MKVYTSKEIQERAKVTARQLIHWCEVGVIAPHIDDRRRGGARKFSQRNLLQVLICRELNKHRLPTILSRSVMHFLRFTRFWEALPQLEEVPWLVCPPLEIVSQRLIDGEQKEEKQLTLGMSMAGKDELANALSESPSAIVVNLPALVKEAGGKE